MTAPKKILAISSPGGHWIQLTRLCAELPPHFELVFATPAGKSKGQHKIWPILDASADDKWRLIPVAVQLMWILLKERPHTVISTGAAPGVVAILLAKLLRKKTIWIDSIANVKQISRSGQLVEKYCDVFLTQWPQLAGGKRHHQGSVL